MRILRQGVVLAALLVASCSDDTVAETGAISALVALSLFLAVLAAFPSLLEHLQRREHRRRMYKRRPWSREPREPVPPKTTMAQTPVKAAPQPAPAAQPAKPKRKTASGGTRRKSTTTRKPRPKK